MPTAFAIECWLSDVGSASPHSSPLKRKHDSAGPLPPSRANTVIFPIATDLDSTTSPSPRAPSAQSKRRRVLAPLSNLSDTVNASRRLMSDTPGKGKGGRIIASDNYGAERVSAMDEAEVQRRTSPRRRNVPSRLDVDEQDDDLQQLVDIQDRTPRAPRARRRGSGKASWSPTRQVDWLEESDGERSSNNLSPTNSSLRNAPAPNWAPLGQPIQGMSWLGALSEGHGSSRASASTASSAHSGKSKRSTSPSKTAGDLLSAGIFMEPLKKDKLSTYTRRLYLDILAASQDVAIVPAALESTLNKLLDGELMPHNLIRATPEDPRRDAQPTAEHLVQLSCLQSILAAALRCSTNGSSESGWNIKVHGPLLDLATGDPKSSGVDFESVTHAHISKSFVPTSASGAMTSRLVDLALVLAPAPRSHLHHAIVELLAAAAAYAETVEGRDGQAARDERSVNQSTHQPLMHQPIAVSVETKLEAKAEDGVAQLGIWSAAGLRRWRRLAGIARALRRQRDGHGDDIGALRFGDYVPIEMPLLRTSGHYWFLLFAKDVSDEEGAGEQQTLILTEVAVGNTNSLLGLYKLLKVLRLLVAWSGHTFRPWICSEILGIVEAGGG